MAVNFIEISTEALASDRSALETQIQGIRQEMKQLQQEMEQLNARWEGSAKQEFLGQFEEDYAFMEEVVRGLEQYVQHMEYAGKEYQGCEGSVTELIRSLQI